MTHTPAPAPLATHLQAQVVTGLARGQPRGLRRSATVLIADWPAGRFPRPRRGRALVGGGSGHRGRAGLLWSPRRPRWRRSTGRAVWQVNLHAHPGCRIP